MTSGPSPTWDEVCRALEGEKFPPGDRPNEADSEGLTQGDSKRYYYGIDRNPDYVRARHAAFLELDQGAPGDFSKGTILMMIYANGFGVPRNLALATHLACMEMGAPEEVQGRVQRLQHLRVAADAPPFDVCDDAVSGLMMGACEVLATERKLPTINKRIDRLVADWPDAQKGALEALRSSASAFWVLRSSREQDLSGTDRDGVRAKAGLDLTESFAVALEEFARQPPTGDAASYERADSELNRVYKTLLAKDLSYTTVSPSGIRATQKAWLRYRDAWAVLGRIRYPTVPMNVFRIRPTEERIRQLRSVAE